MQINHFFLVIEKDLIYSSYICDIQIKIKIHDTCKEC